MSVVLRRADVTGLTLQTAAPMFAASPELQIVLWNEGAEELIGFTRHEVLGRRCFEVLGCPCATRRVCCRLDVERRNGGPVDGVPQFDCEISTRSGERIWVKVTTLLAASGDDAALRVHVIGELKRQRALQELVRHVLATANELSVQEGDKPGDAHGERSLPGVTTREREVVRLLAQGRSTADIAAQLGISPRTARNHIQNILDKLNVHSRLEAVAYASARGIV
jgi:PAS domain S-box-containing protein